MVAEKEPEDMGEILFARFEEEVKKLNEEFNKSFLKPNIVLSGKTGVGKSTLINAIFGHPLAEAGEGKPVSQALIEYNIPEVSVNLFDTKGIELDPEERKVSHKSIVSEIEKRAASSSIEEHMHVMWYCISNESRRIEDVEIEWIKEFSEYMNVVIVLTQTLDSDSKFQIEVEKEFPDLKVCRVLAQERVFVGNLKIPVHGLEELVEETIKLLPEATKRAFTAAQKIQIEEKIDSAKKLIQERLTKYKNLAHVADSLPIGLDMLGKGAIYLYMAKDIMTVMGIPVTKNFFNFSKEAKPLLRAIVLPFVVSEGGKLASKAAGKIAVNKGGEEAGKKITAFVIKLLGKTAGKGNIVLAPAVGFIFGTFNRRVTEKIANIFIEVCADFLRNNLDYEKLTEEEILDILSKNMKDKMNDAQEKIELLAEDNTEPGENIL
ncbi:GTPase [Psychrobacillus sp. MER TA 171]|uniref:GTPase n=1 Tax=Psychrobacillus sp. MER TA 171 TaxID=2939577 RepID=UPI00203D8D4D|nr:GTPase [Psychrobacillus sp. MER TA 171]MCM3358653.1 50S ribosome-binding GTPase [Psychrobacillus sp. MER TA 171]